MNKKEKEGLRNRIIEVLKNYFIFEYFPAHDDSMDKYEIKPEQIAKEILGGSDEK